MATPIIISIPHQLGRAEARRRIEAGFGQIIGLLPGSGTRTERWDGDRLLFGISAMGQRVSGVINVLETSVAMEIELHGVLALAAGGLKSRLHKVGQLLLSNRSGT